MTMRRLLLGLGSALIICLLTISASRSPRVNAAGEASNWPQWRGPNGLGISTEKNLPTEWSETQNIQWKTPIPGRGHSSPIIWGQKIFLTTALEGPLVPGAKAVGHIRAGQVFIHPDSIGADRNYTLKVLCLDRDTGKILWERVVYEGIVYDARHRKGSYASSTPVTDGRYVWAFFETEGLYCYDFDGQLVWKTSLGKIAKMGLGPGVSPVLYEHLVILQCDQEDGGESAGSFMAAVDKNTGKEVWRVHRTHRKTWATPLLVRAAQRTEIVASGSESVISYDPATGKEWWRCDGVKGHAIPSAVAGQGLVFVSAGYPAKRAIAIRLGASGNLTDTPQIAWKYDKGTAYVASPILYGNYLYLMNDKGILTCVEAKTGEIKYEGGRVPVPASFTASLVAFDEKILLSSEDGDTFVIKAGPTHAVLRTNSLGEPIYASPAMADGKLFIRGEKNLYCISQGKNEAGK